MKKIVLALTILLLVTPGFAETCDVQSYFTPREKMEGVVINELKQAKTSIHASLYGITNKGIVNTLIAMKTANPNLDIQICLDNRQSKVKGTLVDALAKAGIKIYIKRSILLDHDKYVIVDGDRVVTGSWNWSRNADFQNNTDTVISSCSTNSEYQRYEDDFEFIRDTMSDSYILK